LRHRTATLDGRPFPTPRTVPRRRAESAHRRRVHARPQIWV